MPLYTRECTEFIRAQAATGKPFLLVFAPDNTHVPVYASPAARGVSGRGAYGDAVQELDDAVGAILDALARSSAGITPGSTTGSTIGTGTGTVGDNTLVLLTSDNGAQVRHDHIRTA